MTIQERFTLRNVYLYLVCLVTLIISIFAAVQVVSNTVELLYPDPGYYGYMPKESGLSEEEQQRQERLAEQSQQRQSVLGLVGSGTTLILTLPLYVYHWRRVQKELPGKASAPVAAPPA